MAESEPKIEDLKKRLGGLLAEWGTEISAVIRVLESQQYSAATQTQKVQALESRAIESLELREQVNERDLALDRLRKKLKEQEARLTELDEDYKEARARIEELESKPGAQAKPAQQLDGSQQAEVEAMRAELAARKSLVKSLKADAERAKTLEKELAQNRQVLATMKASTERDAMTIAELKLNANSWERKYRKLAGAENSDSSHNNEKFSYSCVFTETGVSMFLDDKKEVDGAKTIVIDMTEPLREARDERFRKGGKG